MSSKLSNKKEIRKDEVAISVLGVSKTFKIPHEKITSLRGAAVSLFKKNTYEEFKALDDVSFEVKKGEFFGIIGRNGSGKSTLLKILAGIYQADRGKVKIKGMISPFLELGIGFNPELSGRDNIYLNATVLGLTKKQIDEKFDSIVAFSELERFIDQKLKNYSSGMQVRLAFSVSIHANRDILLMDEVLAVGDSNFQSKCLTEFNKYREMGRTVIIVTHDIGVVQRYCNRAMLLRNGKIVKIGKANEVANDYIQENIIDEENRIFNDTISSLNKSLSESLKKKNIINSGKIVGITGAEFLDKDKNMRSVFQTKEDIFLSIDYFINKEVSGLSFRVSIESVDGVYLTGIDTFSSGFKVDNKKGQNRLVFKINKNPFLKGEYFINISCFRDDMGVPLDYKTKCVGFKIFPLGDGKLYKGFVCVEHEWKNID